MRGLGNDLIEIERMRKTMQKYGEHFIDRIFTQREKDYCQKFQDPTPHFAARFAAKEAVAKALGTGIGKKLSWHDIEIVNGPEGKPSVVLSAKSRKAFQDPKLLIAISHSTTLATAVAVWE